MIKKDIFTDAVNLQREAKKIGLDWIDIEGIIEKIYEETKRLKKPFNLMRMRKLEKN